MFVVKKTSIKQDIMEKKNAKFLNRDYSRINEFGRKHNLSFSSHVSFGDKMIALDNDKHVVLLSEIKDGLNDLKFIDLAKINAVTLRRSFGGIRSGQLKKKAIEDFLTKIDLEFQYRDGKGTHTFTIFDRETEQRADLKKWVRDAKVWHLLLSRQTESGKDLDARPV